MQSEEIQTNSEFRHAVDVVEQAITDRATPGAAFVVGTSERVLLARALGRLSYADDAPPVTLGTVYDVASLTKVVATTTLAMRLYERGALDLQTPVRRYISEFQGGDKDRVRTIDLLAHCGGLLWWTDLYRQFAKKSPEQAKTEFVRAICQMPLDYAPRTRTVYSDLGFLLLGAILERVAGTTLDVLASNEIFTPLGMSETTFQAPASAQIAPTEDDEWRGRVIRGEVHDENAFCLGGVAPHAGVFSTAPSLAPFARMLLNHGRYDGGRLLKARTITRFTRPANLVPGSSRALGWDTPSAGGSCGQYFSASSFGHTGYTGTSLWIDPERDVYVILLTNRVHPSRENEQIVALRPAFHDAVMAVC